MKLSRTTAGCLAAVAVMASITVAADPGKLAVLWRRPSHTHAPVLRLTDTQHDFGQVTAGTQVQVKFLVENTGSRRLILSPQDSSCSCLTGDKAPIIIAPRERAELPVTLDTSDLQGTLDLATRYSTSDPQCPQLTLRLTGRVLPKSSH